MIHKTIKEQIKESLRSKDTIRLETLRGLNALFLNEMLASNIPPAPGTEFLPDEKALMLIKRSAKQRKDSIAQFEIGGRKDLADKERAELTILESFLPALMSREQIKIVAKQRIESLKTEGKFDPKSAMLQAQAGKITGMLMKELAGKADGADVKAVVEEIITDKQ